MIPRSVTAEQGNLSTNERSVWLRARRPLYRFALVLGLCVAFVAPIVQFHFMATDLPWPRSDMAPVALGVQAIWHGRDAYSAAVTRDIQVAYYGRPLTPADVVDQQHFAYPAYAAIVLAPLALVPWLDSELLFLLIMPVLTAASVFLWLTVVGIKLEKKRVGMMVLLTLASWPVMWSLRLCQITLLIAFFIALASWLLRTHRPVLAGLFFSLATIKPQFSGPLLMWLLGWAAVQRRWSFVLSLVGASSALVLWSFWLAPGWFPQWLDTVTQYAGYTRITPMPQYLFGAWVGGALMFSIFVGSCAALWKMRRCSSDSREFGMAIGLVLALTLCLAPTAAGMSYNDVVLLPAMLILSHRDSPGQYARFARWITVLLLLGSLAAVPFQVAEQWIWGYAKVRTVLVLMPLLFLPACTTFALLLYIQSPPALRERDALRTR